MKKLKLQFFLFFLLFAVAAGFLLFNSYRQMAGEEKSLWVSQSEQVFDQFQGRISEFLNQEDARSFTEYRYFQATDPSQKTPRPLSPLSAQVPENDPKGLLGYFQIDPDGSFSTPYLPRAGGREPPDKNIRMEREKTLESLTHFLRAEVLKDARTAQENDKAVPSPPPVFPEKGASLSSTPNVYPKIVQKKKAEQAPREAEKAPRAGNGVDSGVYQKLARRKVASSEVELKAFEEQSQKENAPAASAPRPEPAAQEATGELPKPQAAPPAQDAFKAEPDLERFDESSVRLGGSGGRGAPSEGKVERRAAPPPAPPAPPKPLDLSLADEASVLIDPFQGRVQPDGTLVFFRKIWLNQKLYLQGFAMNLERFYAWLMSETFDNSEISDFTWAGLEQGAAIFARANPSGLSLSSERILFERALGYPLQRFAWRVHYETLPKLAGRFYLNLLTGLIALLGTAGLFFIYRSSAAQVKLSQKRQDFVSSVTHELKTPLTSIRMLSEMLQEGWVKEESKKEEYYRHLHKETSRLSGLIDNVLQLARLEKQTYRLNLKKTSPGADFDEIAEEFRKMAASRGFELFADRPESLPSITYDPEALKEILMIFLDNSLKFVGEGKDKTFRMSLAAVGDYLLWEWQDRGPGAPPSELKKIFEKFYRVENEMTRTTKGTGIGLAMAKMIAQAMGAKIEAENREGGGLILRLAFPFS